MRLQTEYILKGVYLGLLLFTAAFAPDWMTAASAIGLMVAGLLVAVGIALLGKLREGFRLKVGHWLAFLLFLCLESSTLIYAGIFLGIAAAAIYVRTLASTSEHLLLMALGGAALGILFGLLPQVRDRWTRRSLSLLLGLALVAFTLLWFGQLQELAQLIGWTYRFPGIVDNLIFGTVVLAGAPFFYLLTFAGQEEETEIEVGITCALLGLGLGMLTAGRIGAQVPAFLVPVMLYFWYTFAVLGKLRVFKHSIRGFTYTDARKHRQAILAFRRALEFDPQNSLAREGLWNVHRQLDLNELARDTRTLAVLDFDLCLDRAGSLLIDPSPSEDRLQEAERLLNLVIAQRPTMQPVVHYWRAVALTHRQQYAEAAAELSQVLDPSGYSPADPERRSILLQAWQLALTSHPELKQRAGLPQLALPGRRMEAIAAVERHLAENPEDQAIWGLKRVLYHELTEEEYSAVSSDKPAADFDHGYVHQLGLALINDNARWRRGGEYLRIAAHGMATMGPSIFMQIAQAHERAGHADDAWHNYELAKRAGQSVGPKNLSDEERQTYFGIVKMLAERSLAIDDVDGAIGNFQLYTESDRSGLETLRTLAGLFERKGDPFSALRVTEKALLYSSKDKDLLERKDRYYYSVMPSDLRAHKDTMPSFDKAYCLWKARSLLDGKLWDLDTLDWAQHLAELVGVMDPENRLAKVLVARAQLRRGEKEQAVALLEEVRTPKPESFATGEDEEAWYQSCRLLGELYLYELNRPDLAIECFKSFRQSSKSGADTLYKLGQAYEQVGDTKKAVQSYKHVVSYDGHPLAPDAQAALYRLQG